MNERLMLAVKALIDLEAEHELQVFISAWEFNSYGDSDGEALFEELKAAYLEALSA